MFNQNISSNFIKHFASNLTYFDIKILVWNDENKIEKAKEIIILYRIIYL